MFLKQTRIKELETLVFAHLCRHVAGILQDLSRVETERRLLSAARDSGGSAPVHVPGGAVERCVFTQETSSNTHAQKPGSAPPLRPFHRLLIISTIVNNSGINKAPRALFSSSAGLAFFWFLYRKGLW